MLIKNASQVSVLGAAPAAPEYVIPLWVSSGSSAGGNSRTATLVEKGTTAFNAVITSGKKLHTLNANWPATTKFAFEATVMQSTTATAIFELHDLTSGTGAGDAVTGATITTTSTTLTTVRSAQFTLIPGHVYGIAAYSAVAANIYITDPNLIVFPN